jgi:hypothetical protein
MIKDPNEPDSKLAPERKMTSLRDFHWRTLYRDRRFWIGLFFILVAVITYLLTGDLTWKPHGQMVPVLNTNMHTTPTIAPWKGYRPLMSEDSGKELPVESYVTQQPVEEAPITNSSTEDALPMIRWGMGLRLIKNWSQPPAHIPTYLTRAIG